MSKKIKELELNALRATFQGVKDFVVLEPIKMDSAAEYEFRKKLRGAKVSTKQVKNTFAKKVLAENGVALDNVWSGPTVLCWGGDSVKGLAKAVKTAVGETKKDPKAPDKIKVKTAVADGQPISIDVAEKLPTRLEAIGEVVSALMSAGSDLAGCLTGPATQLAGILKAIEEKGEQTAAPAAG